MPRQVRLRRETTAQHATFTGADGEVTFDTTKKVLVVHDGATAGGKPLDNFLKLNPGSIWTQQPISGPLTLSGGDSETYGFAVANQANFNQVIINADAQISDILEECKIFSITLKTAVSLINFRAQESAS